MLTDNDFWRLIKGRRSIRRYQAKPIAHTLLVEILEAAMWAPSAHNRQPWRFCVVTSSENKERLSRRMGERWRRDLSVEEVDPEIIERRVTISHARLTGAAALIIVSLSMQDMDAHGDLYRDHAEWVMATQSVALACQNLLLAAHFRKLGACWMCAPLFVPELVQNVLEIPTQWEPQALITLGYPAEGYAANNKGKEREPLESRVIWR